MTTAQDNPKKASKKSQISIAYKTDASRKSLNHKEKIVNTIKKSTLKDFRVAKPQKSRKSRSSISNTDPKNKLPPYQIQSQRNRANKAMSSISRTVPVKNAKQSMLEFPFEAIKFRNHPNEEKPNQNKTHDQFYIRYDEPQLGEMDMKLLQNSKKITGSYNQRIGRYSEQKGRNKVEHISGVKNIQFKQSVIKLFGFLDPKGNRVISHSQIDYRKVPQAVLYFLGGLFQRIRQKHLYLSQKQFQEECDQIYLKSSNQDVNWLIEQVKLLGEKGEQRPKQLIDKFVIRNAQTEGTYKVTSQESRVEEKVQIPKPSRYYQEPINYKNLPLEQQSSVISFRKHSKESPLMFQGRQSMGSHHPSQRQSEKSAQFGQPNQHHRFSFNGNERISFGLFDEKDRSITSIKPDSVIEETISLAELEQMVSESQPIRTGIKKNPIEKVEDMREQIYAKLDRLKIAPEVKDSNILRQNFKTNSQKDTNNLSIKDQPKENIKPGIIKNFRYADSVNCENKPLQQNNSKNLQKVTLKEPLMPKKQNSQIYHQKDSFNMGIKQQHGKRQLKETKESGWVNKVQSCEKAFNQLQKIKDQFNRHKNTIQYREAQRQNYFKEQPNKKPSRQPYTKQDELLGYQQTRVVKLSENRMTQDRFFNKQNKENPSYQRSIDRLSNLSNSRDRNPLSINLNETLSNSCRKLVEITLPLKSEMGKGMSYSDKKPTVSSKIDKIEELSSKLEQYLMKNAEKIEYSKNFTEKTGSGNKFNRLLGV